MGGSLFRSIQYILTDLPILFCSDVNTVVGMIVGSTLCEFSLVLTVGSAEEGIGMVLDVSETFNII